MKIVKGLAVFLVAALMLGGCGAKTVDVTITSAAVVESFSTGLNVFLQSDLGTANAEVGSNGMRYTFPEKEIIRVELDCSFIGVGEGVKAGSDEQRKEIYLAVRDSATFTVSGEPVAAIWGYWPQKAGKNTAEELTLLYLIPEGQPMEDLTLVIDGSLLGDETYRLEHTEFAR